MRKMVRPNESEIPLQARADCVPVSDTALLRLHHVFGPTLVYALTLIDKGDGKVYRARLFGRTFDTTHAVVRIAFPGGRFIYQVTSTTAGTYTVYPSLLPGSRGYCPCQAFEYSCLAGKEAIYVSLRQTRSARQALMLMRLSQCKHLLAVALTQRLGLEHRSRVSREQVPKLFRGQAS